jgi:hypothetical protein
LQKRRWDSELDFRAIKTAMGMDRLSGKSPAMSERETLYVRALMLDSVRIGHPCRQDALLENAQIAAFISATFGAGGMNSSRAYLSSIAMPYISVKKDKGMGPVFWDRAPFHAFALFTNI